MGDRPALVALVRDEAVLGVEVKEVQFLDGPMRAQRSAVLDDPVVVVEDGVDGPGQRCPGVAGREGFRGLDDGGMGVGDARDLSEAAGGRCEDAGGGSEGGNERGGESSCGGGRLQAGEEQCDKVLVVEARGAGVHDELAERPCARGGKVRGGREEGHCRVERQFGVVELHGEYRALSGGRRSWREAAGGQLDRLDCAGSRAS